MTLREVILMEQGLLAFRGRLVQKTQTWFTDSLPGVLGVRKGSMKADLNLVAANVAEICKVNKIDLAVKWTWRNENITANSISHFVDREDWGFTDSFFQDIQEEWCACESDQVASAANKK